MAQLTVDLSADKATLARIAQFILLFAGYEPPTVAAQQGLAGAIAATASNAQGAIAGGSLLSPHAHLAQQFAADQINPFGPDGKWNNGKGHEPSSGAADLQADLDAEQAQLQAAQVFASTPTDPSGWIAPTPAPLPPPPPPAGIDVDLRGLPWDPRIHASTRAKTAEGNWRQKRNVDPELMTKVEAELRQTMGAPVPRVPAPQPPAYFMAGPNNEAIPAVLTATGLVQAPPVPVAPPAPFAGNAAPPAPPLPSGIPSVPASAGAATGASRGDVGPAPTFPQLMGAITHAFTVTKTITRPQVDAALLKFNLTSLPLLANRPDLVGAVANELGLAL